MNAFQSLLTEFDTHAGRQALGDIARGVEREALRMTSTGQLALTPHPTALGSALTHPWITTDYSEALLELITPVTHDVDNLLDQLGDLHQFTHRHLSAQEHLWPVSMPGPIAASSVPIAQYGTSMVGRMKTLYREGLACRYGPLMQIIAGLHYNFSVSANFWAYWHRLTNSSLSLTEFQNERYMGLTRNFQRWSWLIAYLFGASPLVFRDNVPQQDVGLALQPFDDDTLYLPYATSLRLSPLGYTNKVQSVLTINYNDVEAYAKSLQQATQISAPAFAAIGLRNAQGQRQQLSDRVLQIENEYYASIRPKRVAHSQEKPSAALLRAGVEYIEIRALDVNPFSPVGLDSSQVRLLDMMLLTCLLMPSPPLIPSEQQVIQTNLQRVVQTGRQPGLALRIGEQDMPLTECLRAFFDQCQEVARLLDAEATDPIYQATLSTWAPAIDDPSQTLSGKMLTDIKAASSYRAWLAQQSTQHANALTHRMYQHYDERQLMEVAARSHQAQRQQEQADRTQDFEAFLRAYFESVI